MKGRKPVPTVLRIARGNPSQHKIRDDEPAPSSVIDLSAPARFTDDADARAAWDELAPMLHRLGLFTEAERHALILYCATFARWQQADRHLREHGSVLTSRRNKYPIVSPYVAIANQTLAQCHKLMIEFGLTPVSRTRVHVGKKDAPDAKWERFFGPSPRPKPA